MGLATDNDHLMAWKQIVQMENVPKNNWLEMQLVTSKHFAFLNTSVLIYMNCLCKVKMWKSTSIT